MVPSTRLYTEVVPGKKYRVSYDVSSADATLEIAIPNSLGGSVSIDNVSVREIKEEPSSPKVPAKNRGKGGRGGKRINYFGKERR